MPRNKYDDDDELYEAPSAKIQDSGVSEEYTPSVPPQKSMEDEQLQQSLKLLEDVREVIRKTGIAQEDAAELVRKLWSSMNGIKDFGEEICKANSEVKKNLENLNYQMSEKSEEYISKQFGALRESFLKDTKTGLQEIKTEFLDGLSTDAKKIVSEAQASLEKAQKKIDKSQEEKGIFMSWGMLLYVFIFCMSSLVIGGYGMKNIFSEVNEEDLMTAKAWYLFCLTSPWIWWGLKLFWRKLIERE